jgi:adenine phosphoribosyltransferase
MPSDASSLTGRIRDSIRTISDFPKPGIQFKDITPLLADPPLLKNINDWMVEQCQRLGATRVAGIESRGFLFGMPAAVELGLPFFPIRKVGKLPYSTIAHTYDLEYGTDTVEIHTDAVTAGDRVVIVDDLLATGGTLEASCTLVEKGGADVAGCLCVIELGFLGGRQRMGARPVDCLVTY